jgi:hypothetical protein
MEVCCSAAWGAMNNVGVVSICVSSFFINQHDDAIDTIRGWERTQVFKANLPVVNLTVRLTTELGAAHGQKLPHCECNSISFLCSRRDATNSHNVYCLAG